ncbi:MAG: hypothetical protein WAV18_27825 [Roseiarcus sp.]
MANDGGRVKCRRNPELAAHFRHVEEIARLPRRAEGMDLETYGLYRVSDPTGRVLEKD